MYFKIWIEYKNIDRECMLHPLTFTSFRYKVILRNGNTALLSHDIYKWRVRERERQRERERVENEKIY